MEKSKMDFEISGEERSYESLDCPVCLTTLVKPITLICGHKLEYLKIFWKKPYFFFFNQAFVKAA
jgi:hypothetical protein